MYTFNLFLDFDDVVNIEGFSRPKNRAKNAPLEDRFDDNAVYTGVEDAQRVKNKIAYFPSVMKFMKTLENAGGHVRWLSTWEWETARFKTMLGPDFDFGFVPWNRHDVFPGMDVSDSRDVNKYTTVKKVTADENLPFVWVDDSATRLFNPDDFTVPALAVRPTKPTGFDKTHAADVVKFLTSLGVNV